MGLINWFKDKIVMQMEHDIKMLGAEIEALNARMDSLQTQIRSVRQKAYRDSPIESESEAEPKLEDIAKAFGGQLPIELMEKYKKYGQQ